MDDPEPGDTEPRETGLRDLRSFLEGQRLFEGMAGSDFDALLEAAEVVSLTAGDRLFEEGEPGHAMYVVVEGNLEITKRFDARTDVLAVRGPGEVIGEMSVLSAAPRSATATALVDSRLLEIDHDAFQTLMSCSGSAATTITQTMAARLRTTEAALQQHQKLASLGTMAAGIAHELNNPAAAVSRSTHHLEEALSSAGDALLAFAEATDDAEGITRIAQARAHLLERFDTVRSAAREGAGAFDDAWRREDAIRDALEALGVPSAWELANAFGETGLPADDIAGMLEPFPAAARGHAARYLAATVDARRMLRDTAAAAKAISDIVRAVKSYTYLDQAPVQDVDLHDGLDNTLVILQHKLKRGVTVLREYDASVPRIDAYGSELNQVWTNLIDNAVDAMDGSGTLWIRTMSGPRNVAVEICDDGPGIPEHVVPKLFDPFFTTKPMGKGTGLGLHTVHRIVERHEGSVTLRPREAGSGTCACVTLPLRMRKTPSDTP